MNECASQQIRYGWDEEISDEWDGISISKSAVLVAVAAVCAEKRRRIHNLLNASVCDASSLADDSGSADAVAAAAVANSVRPGIIKYDMRKRVCAPPASSPFSDSDPRSLPYTIAIWRGGRDGLETKTSYAASLNPTRCDPSLTTDVQ